MPIQNGTKLSMQNPRHQIGLAWQMHIDSKHSLAGAMPHTQGKPSRIDRGFVCFFMYITSEHSKLYHVYCWCSMLKMQTLHSMQLLQTCCCCKEANCKRIEWMRMAIASHSAIVACNHFAVALAQDVCIRLESACEGGCIPGEGTKLRVICSCDMCKYSIYTFSCTSLCRPPALSTIRSGSWSCPTLQAGIHNIMG